MKVVYFATHLIQYQAPLLRQLYSDGLDITTIYANTDNIVGTYDPGFSQVVSWDIPLLGGYPYKVIPKNTNFFNVIKFCLRHIREINPDIIWIHGWGFSICRAAWLAALISKKPIMMRSDAVIGCAAHHETSHIESSKIGNIVYSFKLALHKLIFSFAFKTIRAFLVVGSANKRFYLSYHVPPIKLHFAPHAVDNNYFRSRCLKALNTRAQLKDSIGIPPDHLIILFAGKLIPRKGAHLLIEALSNLQSQHPNLKVTLLIVGEGIERTKLEDQASHLSPESVKFTGFVNQSKLPDYYTLCDIFVLPSIFEPWGLIVNEVMNAGKPVIVSSRAGCAEDIVKSGYNGAVFRSNDVLDLQEQLYKFIVNPSLCMQAGARSSEVIKHWGIKEAARAVISAASSIKSSF